jgi:hypothetical protein
MVFAIARFAMESTTRIMTRRSSARLDEVKIVDDKDNKGNDDNSSKVLRSSRKAASHVSGQISPISSNSIRLSQVEKKRIVAAPEATNAAKATSRKFLVERTKGRSKDTKTKKNELKRESKSSNVNILVRPFCNARVYLIIDGNMQFVRTMSSTAFGSATTSPSSRSEALESSHQYANMDRCRTIQRVSNRNLRPKITNDGVDSRNGKYTERATKNTFATEGTAISTTEIVREGEKFSSQNHKRYLESSNCSRSSRDKDSDDQATGIDTYPVKGFDSGDNGLAVKKIDTGVGLENKKEGYLSRLRTRLTRTSKPSKTTGVENLDDSTLDLLTHVAFDDLLKYQTNKIGRYSSEHLIEDEIESFMLRTTRMANDQASLKLVLRSDDSSDDFAIDLRMYHICLAEVESVALWQDYFRRIVTKSQRHVNHHHIQGVDKMKSLDKRTMNCVKRSVTKYLEWNRAVDESRQHTNSWLGEADNHLSGRKTRPSNIVTRNYVRVNMRKTKRQKREHLLEILYIAAEEVSPFKDETCAKKVHVRCGHRDGVVPNSINHAQPLLSDANMRREVFHHLFVFTQLL